MAVIDSFLGKRVEVQEDLRYHIKQGLWAREINGALVFGFTQPALVLMGGIKDMDGLVDNGGTVNAGDAVLFAITTKILYLDAPIGGAIQYNTAVQENPMQAVEDPYGKGWLFQITPPGDIHQPYMSLVSWDIYVASLRTTDGLRNPLGLKGGVSGMCKAVYSGIAGQRL